MYKVFCHLVFQLSFDPILNRQPFKSSLVCEALDLEELGGPEEGLEPVGLDVDLAAVDVADEALHVGVARRPRQDDHRVRTRVLLKRHHF